MDITYTCSAPYIQSERPLLVVTLPDDPMPFCFEIDALTNDKLSLSYLPGGNLLEYFRDSN
jgi:hypothetical protein